MTNKEVCLRLSSPERKKNGCAGGMVLDARGSYEHSPVHNDVEASGTGVQLQTPWPPRYQQNQLVLSRVYQGPEERTSFLGRLSSVGASEAVLCLYCRANTESVIRYRTAVWYGNFPEQAKARLRRFVSTGSSVSGNRTSPLHSKYSIPHGN